MKKYFDIKKLRYKYKQLEDFSYNILEDKDEINFYLNNFILKEWEIDHKEYPDQIWTIEWMKLLRELKFNFQKINLKIIKLRKELIEYKNNNEVFIDDLNIRISDREESFLRGLSIEPLLINGINNELMDGYVRYMLLKKYNQKEVYAYIGTL